MEKKYLAKIIANDKEGLQMISAFMAGAKVKIGNIKYLRKNKIFLISADRIKVENEEKNRRINSICKFEFVDFVKSKNIDQKNQELDLELIGINYIKNKNNYEINLIFNDNALIALSTETIEVRLEDQNE
jgi:hypothetical protein